MKNIKKQLSFILVAGALVFTSCDSGGGNANNRIGADARDTAMTGNMREAREVDFVTDVIDMSAREIAWLNAGISRGTDRELKSQAKKMLSDHEALTKELKDYAQKNDIAMPDTDTSNVIDITDRPGAEWDEEWADEVGDDHQRFVNRFERANRRTTDTALKGIINKNLPVLQAHLDASRKLEARLDKSK